MDKARRHQEGMAMVIVILAAIIVLGAVAAVTHSVHREKQMTDHAVVETQLDEACKAGVDMGIEQIWNQYIVGNGNTTGNYASYRVFLNGVVPNNEDVNGNGQQDEDETDLNGDGTFDIAGPTTLVDENEPYQLPSGPELVEITLARTDDVTGTSVLITSTSRLANRTRTVTQSIRVGGEIFQGFAFAILANNINCILCHAEILSLGLETNTDPALYGSFNRVKVAALESLMVRSGSDHFGAHSKVAGTVYTRGTIYNQSGYQYNASSLASSTMRSFDFSSENGKLTQDGAGNTSLGPFANAGTDANGDLEQFANLYINYPTEEDEMTDGDLPTSFPSPYPDENGDRYVNDDEFVPIMNSADGTISGGVAYGIPSGSTYADPALPASSNDAMANLSTTGSYDGNLILVGTEENPIEIDGSVAINGDLVIQGPVKGWGQLKVRGNTYVTGDVTYADAAGEFGVAEDGAQNGLAVTSGGSIILGDYLTIWAKNDPYTSNMWYEEWIDMREETKTNYCRSTPKEVGYFDDGVVDEGWTSAAGETAVSFSTSELMLFNAMEHQKAEADPTYTPRYYQIRTTQPVYEYTGSGQDAMRYSDWGVETISDLENAAVHSLSPNDYWLSEDQLRIFWHNDEMTRPSSGRPLQFDGLLYSNNSIFCVTHSNQYHNSNTLGKMIVRGGIVCADLGIFVPGPDNYTTGDALKLYYDPRVEDFLRVEDTTQVEFARTVFRYQ